jgi:cytosine/adenosine deaminase-related metal-dependent hydrolase
MATNSILLQGGSLVIHDENDHVKSVKVDLLIEGNTIEKIELNIKPVAGAQAISCTDKTISPGFIDTHRYVWQTLLKGRYADDELLLDYHPSGMSIAFKIIIQTDTTGR